MDLGNMQMKKTINVLNDLQQTKMHLIIGFKELTEDNAISKADVDAVLAYLTRWNERRE